jgi:restriction system protein
MKWRPKENSAFAVLARSPWWVSLLIAAGVFLLARHFVPDVYAIFVPLPFYATGGVAAWRRLHTPSPARVARALEALRALGADEFARALEDAYRREGYEVARLDGRQADLELTKAGRTTLVAFKRWKAQRTGIEPLRELDAARRAREAHECACVAAGEVTDSARAFAAEKAIRIVGEAELARLLPRAGR